MRRFLSLLIAFVLIMSSMNVAIGQSNDYESNWAKNEIKYMKDKMIISGYPDGTFRPTNNMSKSEFYKVINGIMGFTNESEVTFIDVSTTDWYYKEVQKGLAANYILPAVSLNAVENITRGEVARIIGIVFDIEEDIAASDYFIDSLTLPEELKGVIGGLRKTGFINGYPDGTFRPEAEITRAEVVKILHSVSGEIVNVSGTLSKDINTNLVVNTAGVVLKDMTIEGNLYLTEGIGEGDITLDNVVVKGEVSVKGGGANSIVIKDSKINKLLVDKHQGLVRVVLENTTVESLRTFRQAKIELIKGSQIKLAELDGKVNLVIKKGTSIANLTKLSQDITIDEEKTTTSAPSTSSGGYGGGGGGTVTPTPTPTPTPVTLSSISIKVPATKLVYTVGDSLDITGLVIEGAYSNGSKKIETITLVNVTGFDSKVAVTSQILTVTVGGKTATYTIEIKAAEPQNPDPTIVNKSALSAKITVAEDVYKEDYTPETWGPFEIALGEAIVVNNDEEATQGEVDAALLKLTTAMAGLVLVDPTDPEDPDPIEVDKTELAAKVTEANTKIEADYTPESWLPFSAALVEAIVVNNDTEATQEEVDGALSALTTAMDNLEGVEEPVVPKLTNIMPSVNQTLRAGEVLEVSFNAPTGGEGYFSVLLPFENSLDTLTTSNYRIDMTEIDGRYTGTWTIPEKVLGKEFQVEVVFKIAKNEIREFALGRITIIEEPDPEVDKSALIAKIALANEKVEEAYTPESWAPFSVALVAAEEVRDDEDATQTEVDEALSALSDAMADLELKPEDPEVDRTELVAKIVEAQALNEDDYTEETWAPFSVALTSAIEVNVNVDATQEQVNSALSELTTSMTGLVLVEPVDPDPEVDKTELAAAIATANEKLEEDYTPESWAPFSAALTTAIEVNANVDATQIEVDDALSVLTTAMASLVEKEDPQNPNAQITATYHPGFIPTFGNVSVVVQNVEGAAKFDVVYHLSDDDGGTVNITQTSIVNLNERAGLIFYDPAQYNTVTIRIYDATGANILHTFTDVVLVRP
ncbi:S-layer homology domain-containing protein [Tissierella sp.]|uniref:S-layer homology domain-containing protein n=1 Tax=Tissierella sp. TaxID=41274 RepID=UPI0028663808|nr:S-layer homology domain-containing protein [Tissierella sp.]MDR7857506.1 S-layer homology domain-containing protein [Tissierella sp.]